MFDLVERILVPQTDCCLLFIFVTIYYIMMIMIKFITSKTFTCSIVVKTVNLMTNLIFSCFSVFFFVNFMNDRFLCVFTMNFILCLQRRGFNYITHLHSDPNIIIHFFYYQFFFHSSEKI